MKEIKIAFVDFWQNFNIKNFVPYKLLCEHYNIHVTSMDEADYVFFSVFGNAHWFVSEDKIKIFFTGECVTPDFNACDYAIAFDRMTYGNRYFRLPNYYATEFFIPKVTAMENKHLFCESDSEKLTNRDFCSFVVSNANGNPVRGHLYELLSQYRKVDSGGRWMNNVGGSVADKIAFEHQHKFSIACENSSFPGYTTEKIVEAFAAQTIPIYWGDPTVVEDFNPQAFINVNDFSSFDVLIEYVKTLDKDDEFYLNMLKQPALINPVADCLQTKHQELLSWMLMIFEQPIEKAKRYNRDIWGKKIIFNQREIISNGQKGINELIKERIRNLLFR